MIIGIVNPDLMARQSILNSTGDEAAQEYKVSTRSFHKASVKRRISGREFELLRRRLKRRLREKISNHHSEKGTTLNEISMNFHHEAASRKAVSFPLHRSHQQSAERKGKEGWRRSLPANDGAAKKAIIFNYYLLAALCLLGPFSTTLRARQVDAAKLKPENAAEAPSGAAGVKATATDKSFESNKSSDASEHEQLSLNWIKKPELRLTESQDGDFESSPSQEPQTQPSDPKWHYGGFVDLGYLLDFNHPSNHLFRSRGTAFHVDEVDLNMAGAYVRKDLSESSRWGAQLTVHGGKDSEVFGFSATAPNIGGFKWLRHLGPTNVSYLAPVGKGLTLQGGIFGSLIGYDSLYAKDNFNYTRPWGADFTPYFMMGVNASYPFNKKLTGTLYVINGYWHLANTNSVPSSGGQLAYKASPRVTLKETVLFGPHQSNTSFKFWRYLSDSIVEWKGDRVTFAFEYITSWERVDAPGTPRALMMAAQLPVHWTLNKRWSATVRPEVFWDRDGRWTLARQTVKAITTTLEYRIPYRWTNTILRLEHRWDDSWGPDGGFFRGAEVRPGVVGLTPTQHLLVFGLIFTFDR